MQGLLSRLFWIGRLFFIIIIALCARRDIVNQRLSDHLRLFGMQTQWHLNSGGTVTRQSLGIFSTIKYCIGARHRTPQQRNRSCYTYNLSKIYHYYNYSVKVMTYHSSTSRTQRTGPANARRVDS